MKDLELTSYNILLDFCKILRQAFSTVTNESELQNANGALEVWKERVTAFLNENRTGLSASIEFESISIEEYRGQALDRFQTAYVACSGDERWHVTGRLRVELQETWIRYGTIYNISIAA